MADSCGILFYGSFLRLGLRVGGFRDLLRDHGKENGNYYNGLYRDSELQIMYYRNYSGIMEKKMETTIMGFIGIQKNDSFGAIPNHVQVKASKPYKCLS